MTYLPAKAGFRWMLVAWIFILMSGCDHEKKSSITSTQGVVPRESFASAVASAEEEAVTSFFVEILPAEPRAGDDLHAIVRGVNGPLTFVWRKNGVRLAAQNTARLPHLGLVHGDVVSLVVIAGAQEASAETVIKNSLPKVTSVVGKPSHLCRGVNLEVEPKAEDADGDPLSFLYRWQVNDEELFGENGSVLSGDSFRRGDVIKLGVVPYDGEDEGALFTDGPIYVVGNAPPRFVSSPPTSFTSRDHQYQSRAIDPDDDGVVYALASGPAGMTVDPVSGLVHWSIPADVSGIQKVRIEARDSDGAGAYQEYVLQIKNKE
jgi:hypothetical protein